MAETGEPGKPRTLNQRRFAANQTVFRRSNERLSLQRSGLLGASRQYVCECGNNLCGDLISLLPHEYQHVRSNSTWFLIALDHEILADGSERILETHERYQVAEKSGAAGALAEALDTLSGSRVRTG